MEYIGPKGGPFVEIPGVIIGAAVGRDAVATYCAATDAEREALEQAAAAQFAPVAPLPIAAPIDAPVAPAVAPPEAVQP